MIARVRTCGVLAAALVAACGTPHSSRDLLFVDGRAVATAGDSVLAITQQGHREIVLRDRRTGAVYRRGEPALHSPHQIQERDGKWYVSDVLGDEWWIIVFNRDWDVENRIRVDTIATAPHQFAVLPDGRVVVEANDGRLVAIESDSSVTFALVEQSARTGLLLGARGGVLHAVPDRSVTFYNAKGNIRWRLPWPWEKDAYVAGLAVDANGRIHVLAGEGEQATFRCFSLSSTTGEVVRWSDPSSAATFVIDRLGKILPDSASRWIGN